MVNVENGNDVIIYESAKKEIAAMLMEIPILSMKSSIESVNEAFEKILQQEERINKILQSVKKTNRFFIHERERTETIETILYECSNPTVFLLRVWGVFSEMYRNPETYRRLSGSGASGDTIRNLGVVHGISLVSKAFEKYHLFLRQKKQVTSRMSEFVPIIFGFHTMIISMEEPTIEELVKQKSFIALQTQIVHESGIYAMMNDPSFSILWGKGSVDDIDNVIVEHTSSKEQRILIFFTHILKKFQEAKGNVVLRLGACVLGFVLLDKYLRDYVNSLE